MKQTDRKTLAWNRFSQTGSIGAYLLYRAIREAEEDMRRI